MRVPGTVQSARSKRQSACRCLRPARSVRPKRAAQLQCAAFGGLFGGGKIDDAKAYICTDCGYIYDERQPFSEKPQDYSCPKCGSAKRKFKPYKGARRAHICELLACTG